MRRSYYAWFALRLLTNGCCVSCFAPSEVVSFRHAKLTAATSIARFAVSEELSKPSNSVDKRTNTTTSSNRHQQKKPSNSVDKSTKATSSNSHQEEKPSNNVDRSTDTTSNNQQKKKNMQASTQQGRTLYHVLGASQTESHSQLRRKYANLARKLHPDASGDGTEPNASDFSELAAAWSVLSDPKERLRYDRSLKAAEFTDNMGELLDMGMRNAVPFLFRTANATRAAVKTSSKTMQDVGQRLEFARSLVDLDLRRREYLQQAAAQEAKVKQFKLQLEKLDEMRLSTLQSGSKDVKLTAAEALRIFEGFREDATVRKTPADIGTLEQVEGEYTEKMRVHRDRQMALRAAERDETIAIRREEEAQKRLEEAQRRLEMARKNTEACKLQTKAAVQQTKSASDELDQVSASLDKEKEKVRANLRKQEDDYLKRRAAYLEKECGRLTESADKMRSKAKEILKEANELKKREEETRE